MFLGLRSAPVLLVSCSLLCLACTAAYRTQNGGALAPTGAGNGRSSSIILGDEGGPLSRAGLALLGVVAAAGAVENRRTETNQWTAGDKVITETTTTGTINQESAANAAAITNAAADPSQSFSTDQWGLSSTLEIASTDLGGDTWGWRYFLGAAFRFYSVRGLAARGFRGNFGLSFGSFSMDRYREDDPDHVLGTQEYTNTNLGFPVRVGYVMGKMLNEKAMAPIQAIELFVRSDLNLFAFADSTSPTAFGVRGSFTLAYLEASACLIGFSESERSIMIEGGMGF